MLSEDDRKAYGAELKRWRTQAGMTQAELSRASGVDESTISQIENGHRAPQQETLDALLAALGLTIPDLGPVPTWIAELFTATAHLFAAVPEHVQDRVKGAIIQVAGRAIAGDEPLPAPQTTVHGTVDKVKVDQADIDVNVEK